jgi:DNA polymerase-4
MPEQRKIIHIDMDAFYAAVEQRDFPNYRGKPIIVGGAPDKRGVVATASYEARVFGIHSAMPAARARRLCPQAIFVRPRFAVYRQVSQQIREIFQRYTDLVEPLSLDEAYLDVTGSTLFNNSASLIAQDIRRSIFQTTQLTASAGVSYNKFLAKLASDINKPDGLCLITPDQGPAFVEQLPIGKFHGIGKSTENKMKNLGIHTGADLKAWPLEDLLQRFGKTGRYYYNIARAIDQRQVQNERIRKSLSSETTFERDLDNIDVMLTELRRLATEVAEDLAVRQLKGLTLTIKVRYADFQLVTRSQTFSRPFNRFDEMAPLLPQLLARTDAGRRKVRLLGVGVSHFDNTPVDEPAAGSQRMVQIELF